MRIRFVWENQHDVSDVGLRIEIRSTENVPVGTCALFDFYSGSKKEKVELVTELDLSNLVDSTHHTI